MLSQSVFTIPPLFFITCSYIFGLCVQQTNCHSICTPLFILISIGALYLVYKHRPPIGIIILLLLTCGAYPLGSILLYQQKKQAVQFYTKTDKKELDIIGTVTDISYIDHRIFNTIITLNKVSTKEARDLNEPWKDHNLNFQIYTNRPKNITVSDKVRLHSIKIKKPESLSYQNYLIKEGVCGTIFIPKSPLELIDRPTYSFSRWISLYRDSVCASLEKKMSASGFSIFCPLFLGKRNIEKKEIMQANTELFTTWGITHYLARSGLHLIVLIALWLAIFNCIPISFNSKQWLLLLISAIYFLLSWSSIPFYRALATLVFYRLSLLFRLQSHFLHLLTATCFFILVYNPIQLFFLDFQLSFGLTFALGCFSHIKGYKKNKYHQTLAP